jgi:protein-S-isoprenylcysteine O-methyltransferase Ste14
MRHSHKDTAGVIGPPPLIFAAGLLLGRLAHARWPRGVVPRSWARPLGGLLIGLGGVLGLAAAATMRRSRTPLDPFRPTAALVTDGPFRYTRNPIYVSYSLVYAGIATAANSRATLLLLPAALAVLRRGVIEREEAYLERRFGAAYMQYKARVRRWI